MRKLVLLFLTGFVFLSAGVKAQIQGIQWKKIIGTSNSESFSKIVPAPDGGFLLIGSRQLKTGPRSYNNELLLVKVNKVGAVEWQKTYGGSKEEWGNTGIATSDGGFIIVGGTCSVQSDGDVTGHHGLDPNVFAPHNDTHPQDIWVLKINSTGDIVWKKAFGGTRWDEGRDIIKTPDNNYMIVGQTASGDGDITGYRRSPLSDANKVYGITDIWIFKIDDNGNLLWQKCFGGTEGDYGTCILATTNGYIIGGATESNDLDVDGLHNDPGYYNDCWIINIDLTGNINWAKTFGGSIDEYTYKVIPYNNGYLAGASTNSYDGDITGRPIPSGSGNDNFRDLWLVEISENGNLLWQKAMTKTSDDYLTDMVVQANNNVVFMSNCDSGEVYDYPVITKLDGAKNIVYEKTYAALNGMSFQSMATSPDGSYYITGNVRSSYAISDDHLYGGGTDGFFLKFGNVNTITGSVFLDNNANHTLDTGEPLLNNVRVTSSKGDANYSSFSANGIYVNQADTGEYITSAQYPNPNYTITPVSATSEFNSYFNEATIDFAITPVPGKNDLSAVLLPLTPARPGFQATYRIKMYNKGTTTLNTTLELVKDSRLSIISSNPTASSIQQNTISWEITGFQPFDTATIDLVLQLAAPPAINFGDSLVFRILATPVTGDETPLNNADTLKQLVVGSFDPNDKTEAHGGVITPAQISGADPLTYLIRFQNMGTDTAFSVTIRDTLDNQLDLNSLEMIDASHSYQLSVENDNLTWTFNNIKLPDHNINEPASHGYIAYRIKPKPTAIIGDTIKNTAGIYFDYNLPVATNTEKTVVFMLTALPVTLTSFQAMPNNDAIDVKWTTAEELNVHRFEILRSSNGSDFTLIGTAQPGKTAYLFKDRQPLTGYNFYRLKMVDIDGATDYSTVVMVNMKNDHNIISSVYPNPGNGRTVNVKLQHIQSGNIHIQVLDQLGRVLFTKQFGQQQAGAFKTELNLSALSKGSYLLKVHANEKLYLHQLLIQ